MDAEPIAYEVVSERGREAVYAADLREHAERACLLNGWRLVPIYAQQDTDTMHNLAKPRRRALRRPLERPPDTELAR